MATDKKRSALFKELRELDSKVRARQISLLNRFCAASRSAEKMTKEEYDREVQEYSNFLLDNDATAMGRLYEVSWARGQNNGYAIFCAILSEGCGERACGESLKTAEEYFAAEDLFRRLFTIISSSPREYEKVKCYIPAVLPDFCLTL